MKVTYLYVILMVTLCVQAMAHGPIHESINRVTKEIQKDAENPRLYIERGQYYQADENFDNAFADFQMARQLDAEYPMLDYYCAKLFSEEGFSASALQYANRFLAPSDHVGGLMIRASIYTQMGMDSLAVLDFEKAINKTTTPRPEYYVDIARATLQDDSTAFAKAIEWLNKGDQALGFNIVLRTKMIDLAVKQRDFDQAVEIVEGILTRLDRKEKWFFKKAEIYELAKRPNEAEKCYLQAEDAIAKLPGRHRFTRLTMELEAEITIALKRLQTNH